MKRALLLVGLVLVSGCKRNEWAGAANRVCDDAFTQLTSHLEPTETTSTKVGFHSRSDYVSICVRHLKPHIEPCEEYPIKGDQALSCLERRMYPALEKVTYEIALNRLK